LPWLTLASWIGGDRDGNPFVTTQVTAEALRLHRGLAVEHHRRALQDLARRLSLDAQRVPPLPELQTWLQQRHPLPAHVAYLETRYAAEPYRLALSILAADLEFASQEDMKSRLLESTSHQARAHISEFTKVLDLVAHAVPPPIARDQLRLVRRQFEIFGLHAARLDIRQDSSRLAAALGEILRALDVDLAFEQKGSEEQTELLIRLLKMQAPPEGLAESAGVTAATAETWEVFRLMGRARQVYGGELLGPFIISMTRGPADVLAAVGLLFGRPAHRPTI
jgi:phosphoenolpyruvate carboxylase